MYIGLWSRLNDFARDDLTRALEAREVIQATLMRSTIHLVSRADYWPFAIAVRDVRRASWLRATKSDPPERRPPTTLRDALAGGNTLRRKEIEALDRQGGGARRRPVGRPRPRTAVGHLGAPPRGPLRARGGLDRPAARHRPGRRRRAPRPPLPRRLRSRHRQGRRVVHRPPRPPTLNPLLERLDLERDGDLLDLPGAPRPDPDTPAPPRFIGTWDASLLVHARRTGFLPEEHRPKIFHTKAPQSFPTFTSTAPSRAPGSTTSGRVELTPFGRLKAADRKTLESEAERLAAFHSAA